MINIDDILQPIHINFSAPISESGNEESIGLLQAIVCHFRWQHPENGMRKPELDNVTLLISERLKPLDDIPATHVVAQAVEAIRTSDWISFYVRFMASKLERITAGRIKNIDAIATQDYMLFLPALHELREYILSGQLEKLSLAAHIQAISRTAQSLHEKLHLAGMRPPQCRTMLEVIDLSAGIRILDTAAWRMLEELIPSRLAKG